MSQRSIRTRRGARALAASLLTCGLSLAAPIPAEEPEAPAPRAEPAKGEELVCKRERVVGSHIAKRTCRTRAQVEAERELSKQTMGELEKTGGPNREGAGTP
jgi:hypothetical protein